jgi:hypothetical protein
MTFEVVLASGAAVAAMVSVAFGGGLFKRYVDHAKELAVTNYRLKQAEDKLELVIKTVADLDRSHVETDIKVEQFTELVKKLDLIPDIAARLNAMDKVVTSVQQLVSALASDRLHQHTK